MKTQGGKRLNQEEGIEINHRAALKWVFANPHVCTAIPGMTTFEQLLIVDGPSKMVVFQFGHRLGGAIGMQSLDAGRAAAAALSEKISR